MGSALAATGAFEEAIPHFERVRSLRSAGREESDAGVREIDNALGAALVEAGRLDEGEASLERASRGTDGIAANALHNLAALARMRGELEDAERLLRAALAMKKGDSAVAPISLLATEQELALVLAQQGRYREAEPLARRVHHAKLSSLGTRHPDTLRAANNLAEALLSLGEVAEARELAVGCVPLLDEVLGASHPDTLSARNNLAGALRESGELADAIALYEQNLATFNSSRGIDDPRSILARANLAHCLNLADRATEAEREFREAADRALRALGPQHRITLANDANFAAFLVSHARAAEAAVLLDRVLPMLESATGATHPQSIAARITLARARLALEQPARAVEALEPVVRTVLAQARSNEGAAPLGTLERRALEITHDAMTAERVGQTPAQRATIDEITRTLAASPTRSAG